jgi:hypothetical protein
MNRLSYKLPLPPLLRRLLHACTHDVPGMFVWIMYDKVSETMSTVPPPRSLRYSRDHCGGSEGKYATRAGSYSDGILSYLENCFDEEGEE